MRDHYRGLIKERQEVEERKREEEPKRINDEEERRRALDLVRATEEIRMELRADIESQWRKQQELAVAGGAKVAEQKAAEAARAAGTLETMTDGNIPTLQRNTPGRGKGRKSRKDLGEVGRRQGDRTVQVGGRIHRMKSKPPTRKRALNRIWKMNDRERRGGI
ncbi:hypothetical protein CBR_g52576 [Chara braunii]|uniref:Uncharacterized protein n=1 Tax=Chara braunii TaxID=69332 RepID=A0A388MAQ0_CHABU|nr:hypothetical protein CBR_g52576 [Chara braunii]|eukprot:GBG91542.1 hypothetical protein CBR_g52576 [Chara braunii]